MKINSTFLPDTRPNEMGATRLAVFNTVIDGKSAVVGIAVGNIDEPTQCDSVNIQVVRSVIERHECNHPEGWPLIVMELKVTRTAVRRTREVLRNAPHRSGLMLMCANESVYKAAFSALCVDFQFQNRYTIQ